MHQYDFQSDGNNNAYSICHNFQLSMLTIKTLNIASRKQMKYVCICGTYSCVERTEIAGIKLRWQESVKRVLRCERNLYSEKKRVG